MGRQDMLYNYPPDLSKAEKHRLANRIFKGVQKDPTRSECDCCDRKVGVEQVEMSCCFDTSELAFLGPGIPLLFAFIKNCIILLGVFTIVFSAYCLYSNISQNFCKINSTYCQYNIFNTISFANKLSNTDLLSIQNYILLSFVVVSIFLFQYFRYNFRKIEEECDDIVNSPSDYAIILRRLPENITKQDIEKMVDERRLTLTEEQKNKTQNLRIDHIVLSYYMGQYTRVKQSNMDNLMKLIADDKYKEFKPQPLPKLTQTAKLAIIVFSRQESKQLFLYKPSIFQKFLHVMCDPCTPLSNFEVKGERISVERAPEPDDVVWQNSKISIHGAIVRKSIFNILGVIILCLGGFAQYGIALLQQKVTDQTVRQLLSLGLSILIAIFNFIILQFLVFSSQKERNETLTEFNTVLTVKISFFQFLNTGIFVVLANFLADIQNFSITESLPSDITIVMLTNAITPNVSLWLLNYFQISGKLFRWLIKTERMKVTQLQANESWVGPLAEIPYKYAYVIKTIWLTAFYAPLVPIVVPISILGLVWNYFIEKHLYRFVYSVPNMLSSMVNDSAIQLMEYFPLIMSFGEFIIYIYIRNYDVGSLPINWSVPIFVSLGLSLLNIILPMDQLNKCIKLKNDDVVSPPYDQIEEKFEVTYQMTNPAYECKKKRKRDIFLINNIFGGQGKNTAINLSDFIGLNQTDKSIMKDPLVHRTEGKQEKNFNFLNGVINTNQITPQLKPNNGQNKRVEPEEQYENPFVKYMKTQALNNKNNNTTTNNNQPIIKFPQVYQNKNFGKELIKNYTPSTGNDPQKETTPTQLNNNNNQTINPIQSNPINPTKNTTQPNNIYQPNFLNQPNNTTSNPNSTTTQPTNSNQANNTASPNKPNQPNNNNQQTTTKNPLKLNYFSGMNKPTHAEQKPKTTTNQGSNPRDDFKNITKDLGLKYNNSNPTNLPPIIQNAQTIAEPKKQSDIPQTKQKSTIDSQQQYNLTQNKAKTPRRKKVPQENPNYQYDPKNRQEAKKVTQTAKERFINESPSQINHQKKKYTKNGAIFIQEPSSDQKSKFPHVQVYVPGIKPNEHRMANQSPEQKRKQSSYQKQPNNVVPLQQYDDKVDTEYKANEIYNPRFSRKQPIDFKNLYGPKKSFNTKQQGNQGQKQKDYRKFLFD